MNPITYALRRLGVREGGALVVHSSYKSLGPLAGDVQAVLEALRAAVGGDGVLLMPALSYRHVTAEHPLFDLRATPGNVGAIPEVFRRQPGVWRSLHPTHSVCAIGNGAEMITSDHGGDDTPVGPRSPLIANVERRGQILMLGCSLDTNTTMHGAEEAAKVEYPFETERLEYTLIDGDGRMTKKAYRVHASFPQHYHRITGLMPKGSFTQGMVLDARCTLFDAWELFHTAVQTLQEDPSFFMRK